jgi:hypothetical protein
VSCRRALEQLVRRGKDGRLRLDKKQLKKPVVLVLGSGWGAHSLIKVRVWLGWGGGGSAAVAFSSSPAA